MPSLIVLTVLVMFWVRPRLRIGINICKLVRIDLPHLLCLHISVDGMLGFKAEFFVKRLGNFLAARWERPYSVVMGWVRACLSFAFLWAALLCVRGS